MIVLEGIVYQATVDGRIYRVPNNLTTPFAIVTYFDRDNVIATVEPMNLTAFTTTMKLISIPAQQKPYPTLSETATYQSIY